ncbi:DUF5681 domain-containing protein [Maricaulis maris]|uniref:DUF5681 domain-containing protein n=1 Tax=Maricaulis maris TaxID=74318 RepID=UPI003B8B2498
MSQDKSDYEVGYGKPPKATQFKKGQSGNPRGRPKKLPKDVAAHMSDILAERRPVRINGETVMMSGEELVARRLLEKALKGDPKAFDKVHELEAQHAAEKARRLAKEKNEAKKIVVELVHATIPEEECYKQPGERIDYHPDGTPSVIERWDGYLPDDVEKADGDS